MAGDVLYLSDICRSSVRLGRRALLWLVTYVKTRPNAKELLVSCGLGEGGPVGFYEKCGFVRNGETHGKEIGLTMLL